MAGIDGMAGIEARGDRPGSDGEHALQVRLGTEARADRFYEEQVLDHLNDRMRDFVAHQEWFFLATSDRHGECDNSFRAGPAGFLRVLDARTLIFPEYRGNGVHASLGNISENPHAGLLLVDFERSRIGLHINGRARVVPDAELRAVLPDLPVDPVPGRRAELWVRLEVQEAYVHCAKHIPTLVRTGTRPAGDWGTDDTRRKGGDFFGAARDAQARRRAAAGPGEAAPPPRRAPIPAGLRPDAPNGTAPDPVAPDPVAPDPTVPAPAPAAVPGGVPEPARAPVPVGLRASHDVEAPAPHPAPNPAPHPAPPETLDVPLPPSGGVAPDVVSPPVAGPPPPPAPAPQAPTPPPPTPQVPSGQVPSGQVPPGHLPPADVAAWRAEARRALEEAERRGPSAGGAGGWFYRG